MTLEVTQRRGLPHLSINRVHRDNKTYRAGDRVYMGLSRAEFVAGPGGRERIKPVQGRWQIPGSWQLHIRERAGKYMVGPVIGILSSRYMHRRRKPVAGPTGRFRRIILEARTMGAFAFVFAPSGINWKRKTISGYTFIRRSSGGRWAFGVFPFPNVVYNRIPTRRTEAAPMARRARKRLKAEPDLHLFNPQFLNKWQVFRVLQKAEGARAYLPETAPLADGRSFIEFMKRHRRVYLKQNQGSLGTGTVCAELLRDGRVRWRATRGRSSIRTQYFRNEGPLIRAVNRLIRRRRYLMQTAIPLLKIRGRAFDVRALVQKEIIKNGQEKWRVTGMAARIAGRGQITTHRPRGGSRGHLHTIMHTIFSQRRATDLMTNLKRAIEQSATAFDEATGSLHGELSLDVGMDQQGHPWILEINAKPMVFDEPSIRREARRRLIQYCIDLTGFGVSVTDPADIDRSP